jgi:Ca-activated chloride channel family protein
MKRYKKGLLAIFGMIVLTVAALALMGPTPSTSGPVTAPVTAEDGPVTLNTQLVQDKVLEGSPGQVAVAVTLTAAELPKAADRPKQAVDLVIVLDRSGSMQGEKIEAARQAVQQLLQRLGPNDRLGVVTYENSVQLMSPLTAVNDANRGRLASAINQVYADGGTNLGGGLQQGIDLFLGTPDEGRQRKLILISDGLANHGITDPQALGRMAAAATDHHFAVSTVGVGLDFNELLMTTIADHGTGRYYFLENAFAFAQVFEKEFQNARQVAAADVQIRLPLVKGVRLVDAGGYPITMEAEHAVIFPGSLVAGSQRKLFLTFEVPTDAPRNLTLGQIEVRYQNNGQVHSLQSQAPLTVACVRDAKAVVASVDKEAWSQQVVQEEYSRLKEEVADAVRKGDAQAAQATIGAYETKNRVLNAGVGSAAVNDHLEKDVKGLRQSVADTFAGPPAAVAEKQKKQSKALQYESYEGRRGKK